MRTKRGEYEAWERRVAGFDHYSDGEVIQFHDGEPQSGRYEHRTQDKNLRVPVAFFIRDNRMCCRYGRRMFDQFRPIPPEQAANGCAFKEIDPKAAELWGYCRKRPISNELYRAAMDGKPSTGLFTWPDEVQQAPTNPTPPAASPAPAQSPPAGDSERGVGDNQAPSGAEAYRLKVEELVRDAERLVKAGAAKTQVEADFAANLKTLLTDTEKEGDAGRKLEQQPHTDKILEIREAWAPAVTLAGDWKKQLALVVITPFEIAKKADQERRQKEAVAKGEDPTKIAKHKSTSGTRKAVSLREVRTAKIDDYGVTLKHFANHESVKAVVQTLANAIVRAGHEVPGCTVVVTQVAV